MVLVAALAAAPASLAGRLDGSRLVARGGATGSVVPLVVCPTRLGVTPASPLRLPAQTELAAPSPLAGGLAVYTDSERYLTVVAPRGWRCSASYGADGSGGLRAVPRGAVAGSSSEAIVASETSACYGCTNGQACALFPAAAAAYRSAYRLPCPARRPARESIVRLSRSLVAFEDPAFVKGEGVPSGGRFPANGVMTYVAGGDRASFLETCTLPGALHDVCTAILNDFVARYGGA
jgi:hypothetical protein